jgi:hypothetical protein
MLFSEQMGMRYKALRVHRECRQIYAQINSELAAGFLPKIRIDHYYPWLFAEDFLLDNSRLRIIAIGNVLLSDVVLNTIHTVHKGYLPSADTQVFLHEELINQALKNIQKLYHRDDQIAVEISHILSQQRKALATECQLLSGAEYLKPEQLEKHAAQKSSYFKISLLLMGQLSGREAVAKELLHAQQHFDVAFDLYNSFLNWRSQMERYSINHFLVMLHEMGHSLGNAEELYKIAYEKEFSNQYFNRILRECDAAQSGNYKSLHFRQIVNWLSGRVQLLQSDLQVLRRA